MDHQELFELHCKPQFESIARGQEEILKALKGDGDKPGLCDRVRDLEKSRTNVLKVLGVIGTAAAAQFVAWVKSWI